ncbi:MAG: hypothetical protein ACOCNM_00620 [Prevotella pectinovora]
MAKNNDKQFTIALNERQLMALAYACRMTDRLIIGQLDCSLQECCEAAFEKIHKNDGLGEFGSQPWNIMRSLVDLSIQTLRRVCWGVEHWENLGIGFDDTADILLDMQKVMEHALWLEKNPEERCDITRDAFEHTNQIGSERNIKVTKCGDNGKEKR